jgi:hypothetical protein
MKKLLLSATVAILMVQSVDAAYAQYWPPRGTQPHGRYAPYGPRPYGPPYAYAYRPQEPRGPNPLDFFGAFLGAIPMIAGAIPPQPYYPPPPQYQTPQTQTQTIPATPIFISKSTGSPSKKSKRPCSNTAASTARPSSARRSKT